MLTDEELIRELEAGFRDETAGLAYAGRVPALRRRVVPLSALPVAAAAAAIVVLPLVSTTDGPTPEPGPSARPSATATAVQTTKIDLAAFTAAVQRAGDDWPPLFWHLGGVRVPDGATPVEQVEPPARAWVGTDPETGLPMLWVTTPTRNGGDTLAASGEGWSQEQLVHLLLTGERE